MAISNEFVPGPPPVNITPELRQYLDEHMYRIAAILNTGTVHLDPLSAPPDKPHDGVLAYADGANWDPGSGAGFYGYESGGWVKL